MGKLHLQILGLSLENLLSFLDPFGEGEAEGQLVAAGEDNVVAVVQQGYALVPSVNHSFNFFLIDPLLKIKWIDVLFRFGGYSAKPSFMVKLDDRFR